MVGGWFGSRNRNKKPFLIVLTFYSFTFRQRHFMNGTCIRQGSLQEILNSAVHSTQSCAGWARAQQPALWCPWCRGDGRTRKEPGRQDPAQNERSNRLPTGFGDALQLGGLWSTPGRRGLEDSLAEAEDGGRHQRPFGRRDVVAGKGGWAGEEVPL